MARQMQNTNHTHRHSQACATNPPLLKRPIFTKNLAFQTKTKKNQNPKKTSKTPEKHPKLENNPKPTNKTLT
jgi:hypothetical protein